MAIDYPIDSGSKDLNNRVLGVWAPKPYYFGPWSLRDMDSGKGAFIFGQPPYLHSVLHGAVSCQLKVGGQDRHDKYRSRLDSRSAGRHHMRYDNPSEEDRNVLQFAGPNLLDAWCLVENEGRYPYSGSLH